MRVNSIGSFYSVRAQKKQQSPSFQADVRVDYRPLERYSYEVANLLRPILKRAETAYENEGSDNMFFELKPISIGKKGFLGSFFDGPLQYGICITGSFKDAERARKEILENNDIDNPCPKNSDIPKLRERDPEIMKRLKIQEETWSNLYISHLISGNTENDFKDRMNGFIKALKYLVPEERVINTSRSASTGPYQGEGGGGY